MPKKRNNPGRQYTYDEMAEAIVKARGLTAVAAEYVGCSRRTVDRWLKRHKKLQELRNDCFETQKDRTEHALFKAIDEGNITAIIFFLKSVGKDRGYVEKVDFQRADVQRNVKVVINTVAPKAKGKKA